MKLSQFKFDLPSELIASHPSANRDESRFMVVDRKNRSIQVSIKAKDVEEEKDTLKEHTSKTPSFDQGPKTIGDLIKAQMGDKS